MSSHQEDEAAPSIPRTRSQDAGLNRVQSSRAPAGDAVPPRAPPRASSSKKPTGSRTPANYGTGLDGDDARKKFGEPGLASSGGGIRSALFNAGIHLAMADDEFLGQDGLDDCLARLAETHHRVAAGHGPSNIGEKRAAILGLVALGPEKHRADCDTRIRDFVQRALGELCGPQDPQNIHDAAAAVRYLFDIGGDELPQAPQSADVLGTMYDNGEMPEEAAARLVEDVKGRVASKQERKDDSSVLAQFRHQASVSGGGYTNCSEMVGLYNGMTRRKAVQEVASKMRTDPNYLCGTCGRGFLIAATLLFGLLAGIIKFVLVGAVIATEVLSAVFLPTLEHALGREAPCGASTLSANVTEPALARLFESHAAPWLMPWLMGVAVVLFGLSYCLAIDDANDPEGHKKTQRRAPLAQGLAGVSKLLLFATGLLYAVLVFTFLSVLWDSDNSVAHLNVESFWTVLVGLVMAAAVYSAGDFVRMVTVTAKFIVVLLVLYVWSRVASWRLYCVAFWPLDIGGRDVDDRSTTWDRVRVATVVLAWVYAMLYKIIAGGLPYAWRASIVSAFFPKPTPHSAGFLNQTCCRSDPEMSELEHDKDVPVRDSDVIFTFMTTINDWASTEDNDANDWFSFRLRANEGSLSFMGLGSNMYGWKEEIAHGFQVSELAGISSAVLSSSMGVYSQSLVGFKLHLALLGANLGSTYQTRSCGGWKRRRGRCPGRRSFSHICWIFESPEQFLAALVYNGVAVALLTAALTLGSDFSSRPNHAEMALMQACIVWVGAVTGLGILSSSLLDLGLLYNQEQLTLQRSLGVPLVTHECEDRESLVRRETGPVRAAAGAPAAEDDHGRRDDDPHREILIKNVASNPGSFDEELEGGETRCLCAKVVQPPVVFLSDGGHFENLGVLPLLHKRCSVIVCGDGGCDTSYDLASLKRLLDILAYDVRRTKIGGEPSFGVRRVVVSKASRAIFRARHPKRAVAMARDRAEADGVEVAKHVSVGELLDDVHRDWCEGVLQHGRPADYPAVHLRVEFAPRDLKKHPNDGETEGDLFVVMPLPTRARKDDPSKMPCCWCASKCHWPCFGLEFPQTPTMPWQFYSPAVANRYLAAGVLAWNRVRLGVHRALIENPNARLARV